MQKTSILFKYRCYAYHDPETGLWERVRVMKYCTKKKIAEVFMFEQDEFRIVPKSSIMELNPDFCVIYFICISKSSLICVKLNMICKCMLFLLMLISI